MRFLQQGFYISALATLSLTVFSQNTFAQNTHFVKLPSDLEYKFIRQKTDNVKAKEGDICEMHVIFRMGDSLIINTYDIEQKPVVQTISASTFKGDLMEGLSLMGAGDSAVFRLLIDTLSARTQQPLPPFAKSGQYASWEVSMVSVKSKSDFEKEAAAKAAVQTQKEDAIILDHLKKNNIKNYQKTNSGIYYVIHQEGKGNAPNDGDFATVNYTGKFLDGKVFDSNTDSAFHHVAPFSFAINKRQVIAGWDEAVKLLKQDGKGTFYIPSVLAYGERSQGAIPANAILVFDIHLLKSQNEEELKNEANKAQADQDKKDDDAIQAYIKKHKIKNANRLPSGLYIVTHKKGTGELPAAGQKVTVNYTGKNLDGVPFDSNVDPQFNHVSPFSFELGKGRVIKGWDEGVAKMNKGTKATLLIPSKLAYGTRGAGAKIPPNAVLAFDIELVSFE